MNLRGGKKAEVLMPGDVAVVDGIPYSPTMKVLKKMEENLFECIWFDKNFICHSMIIDGDMLLRVTAEVKPENTYKPDFSSMGVSLRSIMNNNLTHAIVYGKKIEAIKYLREITGFGLKEAKDYIEAVPQSVLNSIAQENGKGYHDWGFRAP